MGATDGEHEATGLLMGMRNVSRVIYEKVHARSSGFLTTIATCDQRRRNDLGWQRCRFRWKDAIVDYLGHSQVDRLLWLQLESYDYTEAGCSFCGRLLRRMATCFALNFMPIYTTICPPLRPLHRITARWRSLPDERSHPTLADSLTSHW